MPEKESLFEYMRREHDVLLLQTDERDIKELVSPSAFPHLLNDTATEAEISFGVYLTGHDREIIIQMHRDYIKHKQ